MKLLKRLVVLIASSSLAASCASTAPRPVPSPTPVPATATIQYSINVPSAQLKDVFVSQWTNNVVMSPMDAQAKFDFTTAYGRPNVYYGPVAPPEGQYQGVGIVIAPVAAASKLTFTYSDWPSICQSICNWLGHFEVVPQR